MTVLRVWVPGIPVGQAEVAPGNISKAGKRLPSYYPNGKVLKPWRRLVASHAQAEANRVGWQTIAKPDAADLTVTFFLPRPPSVKVRQRPLPIVKPDTQHLVRAIEDALTVAGVWEDDAQITDGSQSKRYADDREPGALIRITAIAVADLFTALIPAA